MVRSTRKQSNKEADRPPHDPVGETVEPLEEDDEIIVDGFQRLSVLGLEVMTLDGPVRARAVKKANSERQQDHRGS